MDMTYIPEIMLRGATIGLLLLSAIVLVKDGRGFSVKHLGALFAVGTAAYAIETSPLLSPDNVLLANSIALLAMLNCVFFWWFASTLLDDDCKCRRWHSIPLVTVLILFMIYVLYPNSSATTLVLNAVQLLTIGLTAHVLWLALAERRNDLLEQRRNIRVIFVVVVGLMCLAVAVVRLALNGAEPPQWLTTLHAVELFLLTIGFCAWFLQPTTPLFDQKQALSVSTEPDLLPEDRKELERLETLMTTGFYKKDGLVISDLAGAVNIPEHRLRRLINQRLGYRNFTAFLNSYRLSDARDILANPEHARRQITQIAFELGYGSITPFNRAFKAHAGMTPTEFRRLTLHHTVDNQPVQH